MFEHLDDPTPYTPPAGLRTAVRRRVRRRRQRRAAVVGGVVSVAVGVTAVGAGRARLEPQRVEVAGLADQRDGGAGEVLAADEPEPGAPVTILVVGVDGFFGSVEGPAEEPGLRTDTMALVRLDLAAGELRLLPVPRDLAVASLPTPGRINTAFESGGPALLVRTLTGELGVPIDHYVQVDLAGAVELVDALGGIRVAVDRPIQDDRSGLALGAGCQALDGDATLALGRSRTVEVQHDDGRWVSDTSSAFGREARGVVVAAALLQAAGRAGPDDLPGLVREGLGSITVDSNLASDDLVEWAHAARDDRFVPLSLPVVDDVVEGAAVLRLDDGAAEVVAAFLDGGPGPAAHRAPTADPTGLRPC